MAPRLQSPQMMICPPVEGPLHITAVSAGVRLAVMTLVAPAVATEEAPPTASHTVECRAGKSFGKRHNPTSIPVGGSATFTVKG